MQCKYKWSKNHNHKILYSVKERFDVSLWVKELSAPRFIIIDSFYLTDVTIISDLHF